MGLRRLSLSGLSLKESRKLIGAYDPRRRGSSFVLQVPDLALCFSPMIFLYIHVRKTCFSSLGDTLFLWRPSSSLGTGHVEVFHQLSVACGGSLHRVSGGSKRKVIRTAYLDPNDVEHLRPLLPWMLEVNTLVNAHCRRHI